MFETRRCLRIFRGGLDLAPFPLVMLLLHCFGCVSLPYMSMRNFSHLQGMAPPARTRLMSSASEGAVTAAAAADSQAADDQTALLLQEALSKHKDALAKADVRRVTILSPRDSTAAAGRYVDVREGQRDLLPGTFWGSPVNRFFLLRLLT